ncbi:MAG: PIG-L family deacetylase [Lentisphaerae bacterium]|nr:PIG-L family deacetylase [Lentisphaerota bacterium]
MTKRAFAIAAHPDDVEFTMAGTLMLLKEAGYEIHLMHIANGSCGSLEHPPQDIARIRTAEGQAAAALIGAIHHLPLVNDIDIMYDKPLLARVAAVMREVAPEILLTQAPQDYMEDHMIVSRLAVTAAFCRGMPNYPTDPARDPVAQPVTIYHAQPHGNRDPLGQLVIPSHSVDISSVIDRKREMLACHQSQKLWLDQTQGMDSYLNTMCDFAAEVGTLTGPFDYAEGFRRHMHYGLCAESADPLTAALGSRLTQIGMM